MARLLAGIAVAGIVLAAHAASFGGSTANATQPAASLCASGRGHAVGPVRAWRDQAGGAFAEYAVGGATLTSAEAPPSLDLVNASAAELERYGLPPRPDGEGLEEWEHAMRAYRSEASLGARSLCVLDDDRRHAVMQTTCTGVCGNYAGRWGTLGNYTAVTGNVVVPQMSAVGNCASDGRISAWVGIGTESGTVGLLQAGTITDLTAGVGVVTYGFYEWVHAGSVSPTITPVASAWNAYPTDEMYERVSVNTSTHGVNLYVENVSTGEHLTTTAAGIYSDYDPDTAGWIVENHTFDDLANVKTGPWVWTNALETRYSTTTYGGSTQSPAAETGAEEFDGSPNFADIVQTTSAWTSTTSFPSSWYACR